MKRFYNLSVASLALAFALFCALAQTARGAGPMGVDNGWVVSNSNVVLLTPALCAKMAAAGTGWVRIEFRPTPSLDTPGSTLWGPTLMGLYNTPVNNARAAGLQVIGLIDSSAYPGSQAEWQANNSENTGGDGDNPYIRNWVNSAAIPILNMFHDRVKYWEIWNEPNSWTTSPGVGGTYIYPSNFAQIMAQVYAYKETSTAIAASEVSAGDRPPRRSRSVRRTNSVLSTGVDLTDLTIITGGVFGFSQGGANYPGDDYLASVYQIGISNPKMPGGVGVWQEFKNQYGTYPLDAIGQHLYIDQGGATSAANLKYHLDTLHGVVTKFEGATSKKKTFVTEVGWTTDSVTPAVQAQNLSTLPGVIQSGAAPYVQTAIWFQWQDNPAGGLHYGVVNSADAAKASYAPYTAIETYQGVEQNQNVNTPIQTYFNALGQSALGNPFDNGGGAWAHNWGAALVQDCAGGSHGTLTIVTSPAGSYEVNDLQGLWSFYQTRSGTTLLGAPTGNSYASGDSTRQNFLNARLVSDANGVRILAYPTDITAQLQTYSLGMSYSRITNVFTSTLRLTNIGNAPISGPVEAVLTGLPSGVTLANSSGTYAGSPYITLAGGLAAGASVDIPLQFSNPSMGISGMQ